MEQKATARYQQLQPRKTRLVVDLVRGLPVNQALESLRLSPRRASATVSKLIESAIAAAVEQHDVDADALFVRQAWVDEGPMRYWRRARSRGMWNRIRSRSSHISVVISDEHDGTK